MTRDEGSMVARNQVMLSRRSFVTASALAAVSSGVALAGCSAQSQASTSSSTSSSPSSASAAQERAIGGALAYPAPLQDISPVANTRSLWLAAGWHVYEGLYEIDWASHTVVCGLAAEPPLQLDRLTYEIPVRTDARFSDGTAVTVEDIVNAFEKNRAQATYAQLLSFIDSLTAKDDATIALALKYSVEGYLEQRLSLVRVFPASMAETQLASKPIGSGPWKYDELEDGKAEKITFTPNEFYTGPRPAPADAMRWIATADGGARCAALREGAVDACENVPLQEFGDLRERNMIVDSVQGFSQPFLMFNCQKEPFNDVRVRQAFFYAIDEQKLVSDVMQGYASPVKGFLPETFAFHQPASTIYRYDPLRARELLDAAGVEDLQITLWVNNNWVKDLVAPIKRNLEDVGIVVKSEELRIDWAALAPSDVDDVLPFDVVLASGDPSCYGTDPDMLLTWWYGDNVWTQGRSCWAKAGDGCFDEFQALLQQAREATDADRQAAWGACFDYIAEQVPLYALFHRKLLTAYRDSAVPGFQPIGTSGLSFLDVKPASAQG